MPDINMPSLIGGAPAASVRNNGIIGRDTITAIGAAGDDTITPTSPLRLEAAARLAYPGGSMTAASLRRLIVANKLAYEKIAGKYFVTLSAIEEMRATCHVPAKAQDLRSKKATDATPNGSSEMDSEISALDAMKATAQRLKASLQSTS
jgi:hypothetical protein